MNTGQMIARLRTQAELTQEQLAAELIVSRDLVSKWETGKSMPNYKMILKLAERFSVRADVLFDKEQVLAQELSDCVPAGTEPDPARLKKAVNDFLSALPVRERSVFIRRYYYFEDASEIGSEYGIKESTVRTILLRTRKKLKKHMKGESL